MPVITSITVQEKKKNRCNLFVDGEFFSGLSVEIAVKNRLKVGMEISKNEINEIVEESNKLDALNLSVKYVSNTLKTKKQVKTYLQGKGFSENIIWYCIDKLKEYKYIDDSEYAKRYIDSVSKNQGVHLTEYKLMAKGIRKEEIRAVYEQLNISSKENALGVLEKYLRNKEQNKENILKAYRYLLSRGFTYEDVNYAVSKYKDEDWWIEYWLQDKW